MIAQTNNNANDRMPSTLWSCQMNRRDACGRPTFRPAQNIARAGPPEPGARHDQHGEQDAANAIEETPGLTGQQVVVQVDEPLDGAQRRRERFAKIANGVWDRTADPSARPRVRARRKPGARAAAARAPRRRMSVRVPAGPRRASGSPVSRTPSVEATVRGTSHVLNSRRKTIGAAADAQHDDVGPRPSAIHGVDANEKAARAKLSRCLPRGVDR